MAVIYQFIDCRQDPFSSISRRAKKTSLPSDAILRKNILTMYTKTKLQMKRIIKEQPKTSLTKQKTKHWNPDTQPHQTPSKVSEFLQLSSGSVRSYFNFLQSVSGYIIDFHRFIWRSNLCKKETFLL